MIAKTRRLTLLPFAALLLLAPQVFAQEAEQDAQIRAIFSEYDTNDTPGCVLGVVRNGELAFARGFGMANLDYDVPINANTVFRIGSVSKQFAAAAILLLESDGLLSLDDDVRLHIPELPDFGTTITVRHFITHTSGLRDMFGLMNLRGRRSDDFYNPADVLAVLAKQQELNFAPGSEYLYSNSGYLLLAEIVERVTGSTLREFADYRIFQPLGMTNTRFHPDHREIVKNRATGYSPIRGEGFRVNMSPIDIVGAGGLLTTVGDYALWLRNLNDPVIGGPDFRARMLERGALVDGESIDYAMGLRLSEFQGSSTVGHGGSWSGWRANVLEVPEHSFAALVFCNVAGANPGRLAREVAELMLGSSRSDDDEYVSVEGEEEEDGDEAEDFRMSVDELRRYEGDYYSEELETTYSLRMEGDSLYLAEPVTLRTSFVPVEHDVLRARSRTFRFLRNEAGSLSEVRIDAGRVRNVRLVPLP